MPYTQENRFIAIETPLGKDELLLTAFRGVEGMSRLFNFELIALSHNQGIAFEDIVGKSVTLSVDLADGSKRYFNGIISKFIQTGAGGQQDKSVYVAEYRAAMVPWLWLLTLTENSKIFQGKSVPKIVEEVFNKRGFQAGRDYALRLHGNHDDNKRDYCVQYRESDFNFISRLLEEEGISYFFEHEDGRHTLVLADDPVENKPCPQQKTARFQRTTGSWTEEDWIQDFQKKMEVVPTGITLNDYNFKVPLGDLKVNVPNSRKLTDRDCEIYDYPGGYEQRTGGDRLANIRMQEEEARISVFTGVSDCRAFTSGQRFELVDYYRSDMTNKQYVLTQVVHEAMQKLGASERSGGEANYRNQFTCIPFDVPFRPLQEYAEAGDPGDADRDRVGPGRRGDLHRRVRPGEGAVPLGPARQEGREHLLLDPRGAGLGRAELGRHAHPAHRPGGDRRLPGGRPGPAHHHRARLQWREHGPLIALPAEQDAGGPSSPTPRRAAAGFNEFRFEDKKGDEQLFIHAEKNQDNRVKNDLREWVGNENHLIVKGDQVEMIGGDKHLTVKGDSNEKVDGTLSLKAGMDMQEKVGMKHAIDAGMEIHLKAGMNVVLEAGMSITLKAGGGFVVVGPAGVTISGTPVLINSGGSAGAGSGCSPAAPKEPQEADKANPGKKPPLGSPGGSPSPQAQTLKNAAQSGKPFCDV